MLCIIIIIISSQTVINESQISFGNRGIPSGRYSQSPPPSSFRKGWAVVVVSPSKPITSKGRIKERKKRDGPGLLEGIEETMRASWPDVVVDIVIVTVLLSSRTLLLCGTRYLIRDAL